MAHLEQPMRDYVDALNWPTEVEPPRTRAAFPAYLVVPPSCHGGVKRTELAPSFEDQRGATAVARARGTEAAWSKEMFGGICRTRSGGAARMC